MIQKLFIILVNIYLINNLFLFKLQQLFKIAIIILLTDNLL